MLALACLLLAGNVFHVLGLAASGITWTDGQSAYGAAGGDASAFLPAGFALVVEGVAVMAVLLGPLAVAPMLVIAAWLLWSSWRRRSAVDVSAMGIAVAAVALVVLLVLWGDELHVWALD